MQLIKQITACLVFLFSISSLTYAQLPERTEPPGAKKTVAPTPPPKRALIHTDNPLYQATPPVAPKTRAVKPPPAPPVAGKKAAGTSQDMPKTKAPVYDDVSSALKKKAGTEPANAAKPVTANQYGIVPPGKPAPGYDAAATPLNANGKPATPNTYGRVEQPVKTGTNPSSTPQYGNLTLTPPPPGSGRPLPPTPQPKATGQAAANAAKPVAKSQYEAAGTPINANGKPAPPQYGNLTLTPAPGNAAAKPVVKSQYESPVTPLNASGKPASPQYGNLTLTPPPQGSGRPLPPTPKPGGSAAAQGNNTTGNQPAAKPTVTKPPPKSPRRRH